jgi:FtsH-binding integral membrane protein
MGNPDSVWISGLGVLIFAGLTVYDAQRIRNMMLDQETVNEGNMKLALLGALALYLDFINLLLKLLSLFGKRK